MGPILHRRGQITETNHANEANNVRSEVWGSPVSVAADEADEADEAADWVAAAAFVLAFPVLKSM
jgi:hypothetical protein